MRFIQATIRLDRSIRVCRGGHIQYLVVGMSLLALRTSLSGPFKVYEAAANDGGYKCYAAI